MSLTFLPDSNIAGCFHKNGDVFRPKNCLKNKKKKRKTRPHFRARGTRPPHEGNLNDGGKFGVRKTDPKNAPGLVFPRPKNQNYINENRDIRSSENGTKKRPGFHFLRPKNKKYFHEKPQPEVLSTHIKVISVSLLYCCWVTAGCWVLVVRCWEMGTGW